MRRKVRQTKSIKEHYLKHYSNQCFAVITDESAEFADTLKKEQFSIFLGIVTSAYKINENFVVILHCIDKLSRQLPRSLEAGYSVEIR